MRTGLITPGKGEVSNGREQGATEGYAVIRGRNVGQLRRPSLPRSVTVAVKSACPVAAAPKRTSRRPCPGELWQRSRRGQAGVTSSIPAKAGVNLKCSLLSTVHQDRHTKIDPARAGMNRRGLGTHGRPSHTPHKGGSERTFDIILETGPCVPRLQASAPRILLPLPHLVGRPPLGTALPLPQRCVLLFYVVH